MNNLFENTSVMISKSDFLEYQRQLYLKRNKKMQIFYLVGGILLITGGTLNLLRGEYSFMAIFYAIGVFYLYSCKNYYKMMAGKIYMRGLQFAQNEYNWTFFEDKAVRKSAVGEIEINYNRIKDIFETDNCIMLYVDKSAYWIDKNGFLKGSAGELLSFLKKKTEDKK